MLAGQTIDGRYRIDAKIGAGGMGIVYRASHVAIGKAVAIKVLRQSHAGLADVAERFSREAQMASQIKHPNVVEIFDYGATSHGAPYYVMEHLSGHSLAWEIDHRGRMDARRAVDMAIQVAKGLGEAHRHGVIHRDLKPDNVFLIEDPHETDGGAPKERAKILDFGIARAEGARRLTAAGAVVGTPEYMSPEQAQGNEVDPRTDLYALGVILFEMLTGRVPFKGDTMAATLTMQVFDVAPSLRDFEPNLPQMPQLERALARLLAKNRDERPGTAAECGRLLEVARDAELSSGRSASGRATVAIGSWSVNDQSPAGLAPGAASAGAGPAMAPPARTPSRAWAGSEPGGPPATLAASSQPAQRPANRPSVVVREGTPSHHIPAQKVVPAGASAANNSIAARSQVAAKRRGLGAGPIIVLGVGAAVFAALVTVTAVRFLDGGAHQEHAETNGASLGSAMGANVEDGADPDDANAPAENTSKTEPVRPFPAPAQQEASAPEPEPAPEISADEAEPAATPTKSRKKAKARANSKRSGSPPSKPHKTAPKEASDEGEQTPTRPKNDPTQRPEAPSVSLGDLKDPFSDF